MDPKIPPAPESLSALRSRLDEARGALWTRILLAGFCALLQLLAVYLWSFTILDYLLALPVWARLAALAGLVAGFVYVNLRLVVGPAQRLLAYTAAARALERAAPELEESVSTAIEYGEKDDLKSLTSPQIVAALAADAVERSKSLSIGVAARDAVRLNGKRTLLAAAFLVLLATGAIIVPQLFGRAVGRLLAPWTDVAAPSFTLVESVTPGDAEVPRGSDLNVSAMVEGPGAASARLLWRPTASSGRPVQFSMTVAHGKASGAIRRPETSFEYRIEAGDAATRWYSVEVYDPPTVKSLSVTVTPPSYTGGKPVSIPEFDGALKVLAGSTVEADVLSSVKEGKALSTVNGQPAESAIFNSRAALRFNVDAPGRWELTVADKRGRLMHPPLSFPITIVEDKPPVVSVVEPRQVEASVSKEDTVDIRIAARDDFALGEAGIVHNLGYEEKRIPVKRFEPGVTEDEAVYRFRFPLQGLKGGEEVAYYAYATDADVKNGPKEARSDLRFLVVYDEERYASPETEQEKSPALKEVSNLIDAQKNAMKDTFQENSKLKPGEKTAPERRNELKTAQQTAEKRVGRLLEALKSQPDQAFGAEERSHLESAAQEMQSAAANIDRGDLQKALSDQGAALRHLSDVRRIVLSRQGSSALDDAANALRNQDNAKDNAARRQAEEAAVKLPEMLNKTRELERQLARLDDQDPKAGGQGKTPPLPEEPGRHLKRPQEEIQALAQAAKSLASQFQGAPSASAAEQKTPSQALQSAAKDYDIAAQSVARQDIPAAQDALSDARRNVEDAAARVGAAGSELARRELENAEGRARSISDKAAEESHMAKPSPDKLRDLASKAADVARSLQELSGSPFLPPDARSATEQGARLAQEAASANHLQSLGSRMDKAADAARDARQRMDAADGTRLQELADALSRLASAQTEVANNAAGTQSPDAELAAQQEALAAQTREAGNQAAQLASRQKELAQAAARSADALDFQLQALDALQSGQRPQAAADARRAAQALDDAQRHAKDALGRNARQELLAALQAMKRASALTPDQPAQRETVRPSQRESGAQAARGQPQDSGQNRPDKTYQSAQQSQTPGQDAKAPGQAQIAEPPRQGQQSQASQSPQPGNQENAQGKQPGQKQGRAPGKEGQPTETEQSSVGAQPAVADASQQAQGEASAPERTGWSRSTSTAPGQTPGIPKEAEQLIEKAMKHLDNVPRAAALDLPLDAIRNTMAAALNRPRLTPSEGKQTPGDPREQRQPDDTQSDAPGPDQGRISAKNIGLAQRELAHAVSAMEKRGAEPLQNLRSLASSIENAATTPGMTTEQGGKEGLAAALGYLREALEKSNLPDEAVKQVAEAERAMKEAARLPQGKTRVAGPNLLAAGAQRAAQAAIDAIDRAVRERDIARYVPEEPARGYEDVTREYFRVLSEK